MNKEILLPNALYKSYLIILNYSWLFSGMGWNLCVKFPCRHFKEHLLD